MLNRLHATTIPHRNTSSITPHHYTWNRKKKIYKDDEDRDNFLKRLGTILSETSTLCYAWLLMSKLQVVQYAPYNS
jgi:hypothetical protein